MKALLFNRKQQLQWLDYPKPQLDTQAKLPQALIKVSACGICGSDMHAWSGHDERRQPPLILGHEISGTVIDCSTPDKWLAKRVTLNPFITCGECQYCLTGRANICTNRLMASINIDGGFAEYITIAEQCLIAIDDSVNLVSAALTEPVAVCLHGINLSKKYGLPTTSPILIIGAGAIGLITALILQDQGYQQLTLCDTNPMRLSTAAKTFNGELISNPENASNQSYPAIFDCVGSPITRHISSQYVADGGCIVHLGLQANGGDFNARRLTIGEIAFIGSFTYTQTELRQALELISRKQLGELCWLETRPMSAGQKAFEDIHQSQTPMAKIILLT